MFPRLRFDGFIRGNHQAAPHRFPRRRPACCLQISRAPAHRQIRSAPRIVQKRKAQVDGDAAPLFFRQAVGMRTGQRLHQRRFAVVNMPRGSNDHAFQEFVFLRRIAEGGCMRHRIQLKNLACGDLWRPMEACRATLRRRFRRRSPGPQREGRLPPEWGAPTTMKSAPALMASVGVAVRDWSSFFAPSACRVRPFQAGVPRGSRSGTPDHRPCE